MKGINSVKWKSSQVFVYWYKYLY